MNTYSLLSPKFSILIGTNETTEDTRHKNEISNQRQGLANIDKYIIGEECEEDGRESWHKLQIIAQEDDDPQNDQRNSRKDH